jgi:hypothetical protein
VRKADLVRLVPHKLGVGDETVVPVWGLHGETFLWYVGGLLTTHLTDTYPCADAYGS